jgi:hypothetical protein
MSKSRPIGITILAILAIVAAIVAIIHTLQMLHLFPIQGPFGVFSFFTFDLLGAILWGILALIWIWVARGLWNLDPQAWLFVVVLSVLNLILAVIDIIGASTFQSQLPAIILNAVILIYCNTSGVKQAFGQPT